MRLKMAVALGAGLVVGLVFGLVPGSQAANQQITASASSAQFTPSEVTVNPGEKVTITHASGLAHNVDYDDGLSTCPASPSSSAWACERTFTQVGNYTFHCDLHTSMTGVVHVVDPSGTTPTTPTTTTPTTTTPADNVTPAPTTTVPLGRIAKVPMGCAPRHSFRIRLRRPDRLLEARVFVNGKRRAVPKGERLKSRIKVRGLPRGRFTLKVEVTRKDGSRLVGKRRLRTCPQQR